MNFGRVVSIIIPSLNPSGELVLVVRGLIEAGFCDIIVVNDGSDEEHTNQFEEIERLPQTTVLTHTKNLGKGAALKTAFRFFEQDRQDKIGVVTVDGDGQHLEDDVIKCAAALMQAENSMVLGVRDFSNPTVPGRSRFGNRFTALVFRALFGIKLRDTQTGLRGILSQHIPLLLEISGNRFDYETNVLIELRRNGIHFEEIEIETVYASGPGKSSHFRPFVDSVMIFARIFKYTLSSILSFLLDIGAFWLAMTFLGSYMGAWSIVGCTAIARAISSFFNFNINMRLVFQRKKAFGRYICRYYANAVLQMSLSAGFLWLLALLSDGAQAVWLITTMKILVDATLFFLNYHIQHKWVFR